jgi:hypothetical protein
MYKMKNNDQDSIFSDDGSNLRSNQSMNLNNDYMAFFKKSNILQNAKQHEKQFVNQISNEPNNAFLSQFDSLKFDNPTGPYSSNNAPPQTGKFGDVSRLEMERNLALKGNYSNFDNKDMTYGVVDNKNFVHNNMVPYFKSGLNKGTGANSLAQKAYGDTLQRKVDLFTGSVNDPNYRPRTERRPLFNPQVGLTWIYGTPNFTDYFQSRFIPSKERRNEFIHQPVRVTPGLNLGYNETSTQGFHDSYRILPKNVDELRVATKPKVTYGVPIIPGKKGDRRSIIPNVAQHGPPRFAELDPRDMQKSLGYYRGPSIYGNVDAPITIREQTSKAWYGPAEFEKEEEPRPKFVREKYHTPARQNFLSDTPRNITGVDLEKNTSYTENTYHAKPTLRLTTQNRTWNNPAGPEWQKSYAWDTKTNIPDPTLRNTTEQKTWNNPAGPEWQKSYAWDYKTNIPDPTLRNTTEKKTWNNPAGPEWQKSYAWDTKTNIPDPTLRNITEKKTWNNPAGPEWQKSYAWDYQTNIPDPTLRQLTQKTTQYGVLGSKELDKGGYQVEVQGIQAPPTLRQLTQKTTQYQPLGSMELNKGGYEVAVQGIQAPPTLRQLTQKTTQYQPLGSRELNKGGYQVEVQGIQAPPTLRQLTQKVTQLGILGNKNLNKGGYQVAVQGMQAPPTLRQLTQNVTQYGPVGQKQYNKGGYLAQEVQAPTTLRQLTQNTPQNGPLGQAQYDKGGYLAQEVQAPTTLRQLTQNKTYQGPLNSKQLDKGAYQVDAQTTVAPTTLRQLTQNKTYQGPLVLTEGLKTRLREDAENALMDINKEASMFVRDGGAPTTSNYDIGPIPDFTLFEVAEPIQINRDVYGQAIWQNPLQCIPQMYTRTPNKLPEQSFRFDTCVMDNLKGNPYINDTQFKSIEY